MSRAEVETGEIEPALGALRLFMQSPQTAQKYFERVDIAFNGYDTDIRELFEIPEVRNFAYQLDDQFPFWLFFLSKRTLALQCLLFCFLPPFLTEEARARIFPVRIDQLLTNRWFPAMNQVCEFAGFSEQQTEELTNHVVSYIINGKFPLGA